MRQSNWENRRVKSVHRVGIFGSNIKNSELLKDEYTDIFEKLKNYWELVVLGKSNNTISSTLIELAQKHNRNLKIFSFDPKLPSILKYKQANHAMANYCDWGICFWKPSDKETADLLRKFILQGKVVQIKIITEDEQDLLLLNRTEMLDLLKVHRRFEFP